mgnify:CR=1 FL=1
MVGTSSEILENFGTDDGEVLKNIFISVMMARESGVRIQRLHL